jgi:hypothetical protein
VARRDATALSRLLALGLVGAVPELLGLTPGRRIILIPAEDLLLLEDHGDVTVRHHPPRWCPTLLRLLAGGGASKERIVAGLWGLRSYHPELHDPPVRTAIHRLRAFLAPHGAWIEVGADGYRTAVPVHLVSAAAPPPIDSAPLWDEGELPSLASPFAAPVPRPAAIADPTARVLAQVIELERATVPALARAPRPVGEHGAARAARAGGGAADRAPRLRPRDPLPRPDLSCRGLVAQPPPSASCTTA